MPVYSFPSGAVGGGGGGGGGGGAEIVTGDYVGDGTPSQVIVTGLTRPIKSLMLVLRGTFVCVKSDAPAYVGVGYVRCSDGAFFGPGITFVGSNFEVSENFSPATPNQAGQTYTYVAQG